MVLPVQIGDIGKVTQQSALLSITNFSIELGIPSDGFDEVGKVCIATRSALCFDLLALGS